MDDPKPPLKGESIFDLPGEEDQTLEDLEKGNRLNLKESINNFLFKWVPPSMTIGEFEKVAVELYDSIWNEWVSRDAREVSE